MSYAIEKSVPLPDRKIRTRSPYPYKYLEIGDSFLVPLARDKSPSSIYASMTAAKRRFDINLTSARVDGGVRVWRIAKNDYVTAEVTPPDAKGGA